MTAAADEPVAAIPVAVDRLVVNHCGKSATETINSWPDPMPVHIPWASSSCQNRSARDVIIRPNTTQKVPHMSKRRGWPRSSIGPANVALEESMKLASVPIQLMVDSLVSGMYVVL